MAIIVGLAALVVFVVLRLEPFPINYGSAGGASI